MPRNSAEFHPELRQAQKDLQGALKEACAVDLGKANTGELIRVDELLAIAGDSAKKAISVRRRMRRDAGEKGAAPTPAADPKGATSRSRVFEDAKGVRWTTIEVHPSKPATDRARLPGPFQDGWLSFDCGSATRRLSPIPDGWHQLPDDELRQLCIRAEASHRPH